YCPEDVGLVGVALTEPFERRAPRNWNGNSAASYGADASSDTAASISTAFIKVPWQKVSQILTLCTCSGEYSESCIKQRGADRAEYGKQVHKELAERLSSEFGSGFSR